MKSAAVRFWLSVLLLAVAVYGVYTGWKVYDRLAQADAPVAAINTPQETLVGRQVQPFKLTDQSGREFDSQELQGQVWVASFFFSSCPGACIKMNNTIAALQGEFNHRVKFVSVTVDPAHDSPEVLDRYARHYGADPERWLFLTGPEQEIRRLSTEDFQVAFGPSVHSDRLMVVDRNGKVQGAYRATEDSQVVLLKRKLAELIDGV
jgi:cytochrome oxidase Cu insertion factor (SCO1/SenC/PrrC family)